MDGPDVQRLAVQEPLYRLVELSHTKMDIEWAQKEPKLHRLLSHVSLYESLCLQLIRQQAPTWSQYGELDRRPELFAFEWHSEYYRCTTVGGDVSARGQYADSPNESVNSVPETKGREAEDPDDGIVTWEVRDYSRQLEKRQVSRCEAYQVTLSNRRKTKDSATIKFDTSHAMPGTFGLYSRFEQPAIETATHKQNIWTNF